MGYAAGYLSPAGLSDCYLSDPCDDYDAESSYRYNSSYGVMPRWALLSVCASGTRFRVLTEGMVVYQGTCEDCWRQRPCNGQVLLRNAKVQCV